MIKLSGVALQRGKKLLLNDADMTIYPGQKWGLIGVNGSGKSSLFKMLCGTVQADMGQCHIPKDWQIAHMAQEVSDSGRCALDYVLDGDAELRSIENDIEQYADDGERLAVLYSNLEHIDGYTARARAEQLLHGLGFEQEDFIKPVNDFSGGWRIRLNLAQSLMCRSHLLLLDEPTNHLDLDATLWLETWLQRYKGTLFIISHDRDFLDNVVDHVASIEGHSLISYTGNYSSFERQKAERLSVQQQAYEKQQARVAQIEDFVRRFRAKATKAKQAQSRLKELERMEKIAPAHIDSPFTFSFPKPDRVPDQMITLTEAAIGYGDTPVVENIELSLLGSSRIGLLGHNGAGKSTLIKALANHTPLLKGERVESAHVRVGYFAQHQLEALDLDASGALHLQRLTPKATEQDIRNFLGSFGFIGDRALEGIRHFSGGEKARLALAILAWQKPNLLFLDEPTNHLDLEVRHALTLALQAYEGAIVVVSHDRHLLKNTVEEFILVDSGKAEIFDGDLDDYQRWLLNREDAKQSSDLSPKTVEKKISTQEPLKNDKTDKKEQRQQAAARREQLKPLKNEIKRLENEIAKLQKTATEIESRLADPALYEGATDDVVALTKEQSKVNSAIEAAEELWIEKNEALEQLLAIN